VAASKTVQSAAAVISGIGQSAVGRRLGRSGLDLTIEAVKDALQHSGLSIKDIDGLACWPGRTAASAGFAPVSIPELHDAMGMDLNWYSGGGEGPGQLSSVINAAAAVSTGLADHVICFRTVTESSTRTNLTSMGPLTDWMQWLLPFHAYSAANWTAQYAQRYFHEFGATREALAALAIHSRNNAALNSKAVYRQPLTLDDYLSSRMISSPLCLYDCDVPVDGSTVIIVSRRECTSDLHRQPIHIEAMGCRLEKRHSWDQASDLTTMSMSSAAKSMWSRTKLTPDDVDFAELYDGFSIITLFWLEAFGFCGKGEAADFVMDNSNIALDGKLPLNTHGGQLSAGRTHGLGFVHEACAQIWREAGRRQIQGPSDTAAVGVGGGTVAAAMILMKNDQ